MKLINKKCKLFFLSLLLCAYYTTLEAQLPLDDPGTRQEWVNDNSIIAHTFAPVYFQFFNNTHGDGGRHDMPLRVNYDNDWNHLNNWDLSLIHI